MKLTPSENKLLELIGNAGGSYCPGRDAHISADVHRLLRKLARRGVLIIEPTDDGERFSLVEALHA
jgi:hypothetical protein